MKKYILSKFGIEYPEFINTTDSAHLPQQWKLFISLIILVVNLAQCLFAPTGVAVFTLSLALLSIVVIVFFAQTLPRGLRWALSLLGLILVFSSYSKYSLESGLSIIIILLNIKYLEAKTQRDYYVLCIILYFITCAGFLINNTLISTGFMLITLLAIICLQYRISYDTTIKSSIYFTFRVLYKALLLALLLFILFPRLPGGIGISTAQGGNNKLSETLQFNALDKSVFSDEKVFYAEFSSKIPAKRLLYWRSKTLDKEQAFNWRTSKNKKPISHIDYQIHPKDIHYQILHQPSADNYLPYLETSKKASLGTMRNDFSIYTYPHRNGDFQYKGIANTAKINKETLSLSAQKALVKISEKPSKKLQKLLKKWQKQSDDPQQRLQYILNYFSKNNFSYSLKIPSKTITLESFLFSSKIGYCQHYASAFTSLARHLNIPARIVLGYHGGKINANGNYIEVRYSDAHAWSEVWIDNQWLRFDPTRSVAPQRIDLGIDALLQSWNGESFTENQKNTNSLFEKIKKVLLLDSIQPIIENLSYQWTKWVINFNSEKQQQLYEKLSILTKYNYLPLIILFIFGLTLWYLWAFISKKSQKAPKIVRIYQRFLHKCKKSGIPKKHHETPLAFAQRASQKKPQYAKQIQHITNLYLLSRYSNQTISIDAFKQAVKNFTMLN